MGDGVDATGGEGSFQFPPTRWTRIVAANGEGSELVMAMPFTEGDWQECQPVKLTLKKGRNVLRFSRNNPPQYGMAVKSFALRPLR